MTSVDLLTAEGIAQVGFPIAACIYLLYERTKFNERIVVSLEKVAFVVEKIEERIK